MCWHRTVGRLRVETGCVCFLPFLVDRLEEEIEREEEEEEVEEVDVVLTDLPSFSFLSLANFIKYVSPPKNFAQI